jgi:ABC-type multidrug transport system fused ATPase/permease subunit
VHNQPMLREIRRRFALLSPAERVRWGSMAPLGLAAAGLEAAGGALVFALVSVILDPGGSRRSVDALRALVPGSDPRHTVVTLAAYAAAVHITKNLLVIALAWWRARVVAFDTMALSTRLLRAYLAAPWPFHLRRGSAGLMETIHGSAPPFFEVFEAVATVFTEAAVVAGLAAVAIWVAPFTITAVCAGIVLVVGAALRLTRDAQRRGGARRFELGTALYRHVQHSLGAIKEIRILGRGPFFVEAFSRDARERAAVDTMRATLDAVPRVLLETMFVLGMLAVITIDGRGNDPASVVPLIGLYAYTGFRVIPAANRIAQQIGNLRWSLASLSAIVSRPPTSSFVMRKAASPY